MYTRLVFKNNEKLPPVPEKYLTVSNINRFYRFNFLYYNQLCRVFKVINYLFTLLVQFDTLRNRFKVISGSHPAHIRSNFWGTSDSFPV